jgi:hypothetical protein
LKKTETILIYIISFIFIVVTVDVLNGATLRNKIVVLFCNDTKGDCHFEVENIYGSFHYTSSFISLLFGSSNTAFVISQIIISLALILLIKLLFVIVRRLSSNKKE